jgi:hypothetical protein
MVDDDLWIRRFCLKKYVLRFSKTIWIQEQVSSILIKKIIQEQF